MLDDRELLVEVELALETFIREYKETHSERYPGSGLLARIAIQRTEEILGYRIMKNLFGKVEE